jgi:hypothetical protein
MVATVAYWVTAAPIAASAQAERTQTKQAVPPGRRRLARETVGAARLP